MLRHINWSPFPLVEEESSLELPGTELLLGVRGGQLPRDLGDVVVFLLLPGLLVEDRGRLDGVSYLA